MLASLYEQTFKSIFHLDLSASKLWIVKNISFTTPLSQNFQLKFRENLIDDIQIVASCIKIL
jgi:hypothetical protein